MRSYVAEKNHDMIRPITWSDFTYLLKLAINVLWTCPPLKYQDGLISRKICVVDIQYLPLPSSQATITSHLIFLNVQVQCHTPPHIFVWKYGESTKFLTHFLLANQISGVLYLSFHSKDVLFFYATLLLLPLHFLPSLAYVVVGQNVWGQLVQQHWEGKGVNKSFT